MDDEIYWRDFKELHVILSDRDDIVAIRRFRKVW